jgi:hypothetical protein
MEESFSNEIRRFDRFQYAVIGLNSKTKIQKINLKTYAEYVLREGTIPEKRQLMSYFSTQLKIVRKKIVIE